MTSSRRANRPDDMPTVSGFIRISSSMPSLKSISPFRDQAADVRYQPGFAGRSSTEAEDGEILLSHRVNPGLARNIETDRLVRSF
jgi:hypothetical protein